MNTEGTGPRMDETGTMQEQLSKVTRPLIIILIHYEIASVILYFTLRVLPHIVFQQYVRAHNDSIL